MENLPTQKGLIDKGLDMMKDPNVSKAGRIGAVGLVAIGAIVWVGKATIDAMSKA